MSETQNFTPPDLESQYVHVHPSNIPPEQLAEMKQQITDDGVWEGKITQYSEPTGAVEVIEPEHPARKRRVGIPQMDFGSKSVVSGHSDTLRTSQVATYNASPVSKTELVLTKGIDSPELEAQGGAVAADVLTLRLAAEEVQKETGIPLAVPEVAGGESTVLESLSKVTFDPRSLKVVASIDTGKLTWERPAIESSLAAYSGQTKQSALLGKGKVAIVDGCPVSNGIMELPDGRRVELWFAEVSPGDKPTRYGLVERASTMMQGFKSPSVQAVSVKRNIPATEIKWEDEMPEIVSANNGILNSAKQEVRFVVDYSGARAAASTTLGLRGADFSPVATFGDEGPVMYWLSEQDGDLPFAVTQTSSEAWLEPGQRPNFDF